MKWKYYNNQWHDENGKVGTPAGKPPSNPKNGTTKYDDGVVAFKPPAGYKPNPVNCFGGSQKVWFKDSTGLFPVGDSVALQHLIDGAYGKRGDGGWHDSSKRKGASGFYVHPSRKDNTLYLVDNNSDMAYDDGNGSKIPMIEVVKVGKVSDRVHKF